MPFLMFVADREDTVFEFYKRSFINVEGIDRSAFLITKARNKSKLSGYKIVFKEGDSRNLQYAPGNFDVVTILGNSFGYFQHTVDDISVLQSAFKILKTGGKILIDIADGNFLKYKFVPRSGEWFNNNYFVCRERSLSANKKKLISREVITHTKRCNCRSVLC